MDYINALVSLRKSNKYTQKNIAEYLNISRSTYNDIEHQRIKLSAEDFLKLCAFYDVSPNIFVDDKVNIVLSQEEITKIKDIKNIFDMVDKKINFCKLINNNSSVNEIDLVKKQIVNIENKDV